MASERGGIDQSGIRHNREHGERIATLEEASREVSRRLNSLDAGMIEVKSTLEGFKKRWWIGIGIVCGVIFAAGSGTGSLKEVVGLLSKLAK